MELSCPRTIAALMRTCRALYRDSKGPRLLLRNGAALATDVDILSFSAFMFASVPSGRFRHLHSLTVSKGGFSDDAVRVLASIVAHADLRLDSLALVDAEEVLSSGSPIWTGDEQASRSALWDAFSWLPTLKHIKMTSIDERAHRLLDYLPNTLVSAMLAFDSPGAEWGALNDPETRNPIVRLGGSADTLEVLSGSGFDVRPDAIGYDVVYPRVRRIHASYKSGGAMPATAAYVQAFPNVEFLALTAPRAQPWQDTGASVVLERLEARAVREANRDDQVNHGSWQRLRVVEGTAADVWALGLVCHVPELRLQGDNTIHGYALGAGGLQDILDDVRPSSLALIVVGSVVFGPDGPLSRVLRAPVAQCLHALDVELVFQPSDGDVELTRLLEDILETMGAMTLRTLKLTLNYGLISRGHERTPPPGYQREYFCPLEKYVVTTDLEKYAERVVDAIPSMEYAEVVRSCDRKPHEYMLGPVGRDSPMPGGSWSDDGSECGNRQVMGELAELGFGNAEEEEGW
ncbi:uncharacterized protein TRAVEDRAFT_31163 [Trametes versicolor FP-101664 SS1]|uniref:uncharacterized protein n=1 Tax=Trametes versicolor (strain FP-101664) TaxID=717944 RepID=UPI0004624458|nr:uncharacterized protein TRAVEDRAFT_31163 [Trametes versicolor FP-101664 SS1]EIW53934.1 hypothetical protein TRAVEDRAFT_31163 [Trametes versicolor FP-101664 SS1]